MPKGGVAEDVLKAAVTEGYDVHRWEHMHSPYIRLANDISEKTSVPLVRSSKLRRNLRKMIKKLEAEGGLKVHHFDRADPGMLHRFYELEASGWKGQQGSAILSSAKETNFWNTIAAGAAKNHYLSVTALEHKGNIVAISLGFTYRNRLFGMKLGYDNQLKSYSMGQLLVWADTGTLFPVQPFRIPPDGASFELEGPVDRPAEATCNVLHFPQGVIRVCDQTGHPPEHPLEPEGVCDKVRTTGELKNGATSDCSETVHDARS